MSRSARRLEYPSTLVGSAALSVEMLTNRSVPASRAASTSTWVPHTLVLMASMGCISSSGRCLRAARVEDHLGAVLLEDLGVAVGVADVAHHQVAAVEQGPALDRELHRVEGGLVTVEQDELGGGEAVELPRQLGADRTAGAR